MNFLSLRRTNRQDRYVVYSYSTVTGASEGVYREKGSKFLAFAYPVKDERDVKEKILTLKKVYFDARHHCYAYVLNPDKSKHRAVDDGEPNHSAGAPILGQIRSRNLTNVLVVVVRYFGGIKLGVGGLINAYKTAAQHALNNATAAEREVLKSMVLHFPYVSTPDVMKLVKEFELVIQNQSFEDTCSMEVRIRLRSLNDFLEKIKQRKAMGVLISAKEIPLS